MLWALLSTCSDPSRYLRQVDLADGSLPADSHRPLTHAEVTNNYAGVIPYSHAQPYLRVMSAEPVAELPEDKIQAKRAREEEETEAVGECVHFSSFLELLADAPSNAHPLRV